MHTDFIQSSESNRLARWLVPAIIVSLLLHVGFVFWSRGFHFIHFGLPVAPEEPVKSFRLARIDLQDPPPEAIATPTPPPVTPSPVPIQDRTLPNSETPTLETAPKPLPKIDTKQLEGSGHANPSLDNALTEIPNPTAPDFLTDPTALTKNLLSSDPEISKKNPAIDVPQDAQVGQGTSQIPGFSDLDTLLTQTGPLSSKTAPILIPSDLLYDYDSANLGPQAIESLKKLGTLIQRNPQSRFVIEGYTDSFGSDAYNLQLSKNRAESVKTWLVGVFGIADDRIRTEGFGDTKLIVPATGDIDAQRPNRRVEIVIQED